MNRKLYANILPLVPAFGATVTEQPIPAKISKVAQDFATQASLHVFRRQRSKMPKFVPRQRKHKVLARQKQHGGARDEAEVDANALEVLPAAQKEREERKKAMKEELVAEAKGKMSSKKKKRLDKYIVRLSLPLLRS